MKTQRTTLLVATMALALTWIGSATRAQSPEEFKQRRAAFREQLESNRALVLRGRTGRNSGLGPSTFRQDDTFFYLTGMTESGGALIVLPDGKETLFGRSTRGDRSDWDAIPAGLEEAGEKAGITDLKPMGALDGAIGDVEEAGLTILTDRNASSIVNRLRRYKSPAEIEKLKMAIDITNAAQREVMRTAAPGMFEYQLQSILEHVFSFNGAQRVGFASIVGSGPNSCILHWSENTRRIEAGDVVVVDIGAEFDMYTADVTRTIPISGKFSPRQREIYEIVLAANEAGIAMVAPGVNMRDITAKVNDILMEGLVKVGLIETKNRNALRQYYYHGLSHALGLNVHDVGGLGTLEPGMVLTIEPGLYIREEGIGFRIEDDIVVTETGHLNLTASSPKTVEAIEAMMAEAGTDVSRYVIKR